jgi:hypothetical protein
MFTPAFARVGPIVEIQPLTILNLFASYEGYGYFGTFDLLASFPSAASEYGPDQLDELDGEAELGSQLTLGATLQLKAGPFAVRSELRMMRPDFTLPDGQRVLYDQQYDMLVADGGWMLNNDVSAVWLSDFGLVAGLRYSFTDAYYRDEDFLPGEDPGPADDNRLQRLGAIVAYTLDRTPGGRYSRPTLLLIAQWHLEHRYRTGQQVSRALPLLALGFQFRGDLLDGGR